MSKQLSVKSLKSMGGSVKQMFDETQSYLSNIGFERTPFLAITDKEMTVRTFLFTHGKEKIILEYKQDMIEETIKLVFSPMEIKFVYDILLLRFNQLARDNKKGIFIYKE